MTTCAPCEHVATHPGDGWGDAYITHCRHCHATWKRSTNITHCVRCHRTFKSPGICDRHNDSGEDRCHDPASIGMIAEPNQHDTPIWRPAT